MGTRFLAEIAFRFLTNEVILRKSAETALNSTGITNVIFFERNARSANSVSLGLKHPVERRKKPFPLNRMF